MVGSATCKAWTPRERPPDSQGGDRFGHRVNVVEYHQLSPFNVPEHGSRIAFDAWRIEKDGRLVVRQPELYDEQVEAGHGCPIAITFASIPAET